MSSTVWPACPPISGIEASTIPSPGVQHLGALHWRGSAAAKSPGHAGRDCRWRRRAVPAWPCCSMAWRHVEQNTTTSPEKRLACLRREPRRFCDCRWAALWKLESLEHAQARGATRILARGEGFGATSGRRRHGGTSRQAPWPACARPSRGWTAPLTTSTPTASLRRGRCARTARHPRGVWRHDPAALHQAATATSLAPRAQEAIYRPSYMLQKALSSLFNTLSPLPKACPRDCDARC